MKKYHCIICSTKINYNINFPFCNSCYEPFKNKKITHKIDGEFCHLCRSEKNKVSNIEPLCIYCTPFGRKDNSINKIYIEKLNWYKDEHRLKQILPKWDITNNDKIVQFQVLELLKIISKSSDLNTEQIFENKPSDIKRIINILRLWEFGLACLPPVLEEENKTINFRDGRHRVLSAYLVGCENIPITLVS
ncbi:MAG: hypothetical protein Q4G63_05550 [Bacteroidia bacterium]|nr:hypothetical protein [Bacteroidia bacterium]